MRRSGYSNPDVCYECAGVRKHVYSIRRVISSGVQLVDHHEYILNRVVASGVQL